MRLTNQTIAYETSNTNTLGVSLIGSANIEKKSFDKHAVSFAAKT